MLAKAVCQAMERLSVPTPSRASFAPTDILSNTKPVYTQIKCGSEPARENGVSGDGEVVCADAFASKLCSYRFLSNTKPGHTPNQMWE